MKKFFLLICLVFLGCSPSYQREHLADQIKELAKKDYQLDVEVIDKGETVGVQFVVGDLLAELMASDQQIWSQIENLIMVLSRIGLSVDRPPSFIVLDVMGENNKRVHLVFTRYVKDIQKIMADAMSRNQFLDRLLIEFVIGDKKIAFDPEDTDLVRFMMMAVDPKPDERVSRTFEIDDVQFSDFLAKVAARSTHRYLKEKGNIESEFLIREVKGEFFPKIETGGQFRILIDLVSRPAVSSDFGVIETRVLPAVAKEVASLFQSYRFDSFGSVVVVEKNSGKLVSVPK